MKLSKSEKAEIADFNRRHDIMAKLLKKGKLVYIPPGKELSDCIVRDVRPEVLRQINEKP
jgi:hypothetical protein